MAAAHYAHFPMKKAKARRGGEGVSAGGMAREEARRRARAADRPAQPADGIEGACRPRAVPPVKAIALGITP